MRWRRRFVAFICPLAFLFVVFVALGSWQVYRYGVRRHSAQAVATRVQAAPVPAPGADAWPRIRAGHLQFLHVELRGHYGGWQTLVRGTSKLGYGFWVMAPLETTRGFTVLVNRGWIPPDLPQQSAYAQAAPPAGEVTVTGLLRLTERGGGFLRRNRPQAHQWYSRDAAAIAAAHGLPADEVAPYFVDAGAAPNDPRWPVAGLTVVSFYNESNWYAVIWYLLALGMVLGGAITVRYERRLAPRPRHD